MALFKSSLDEEIYRQRIREQQKGEPGVTFARRRNSS